VHSLILAAATGLLLVTIFPGFNLALLAPLALVPLLLALDEEACGRRRFLLGWIAGSLFWGGVCYWIYYTMHVFGGVPAPGAAALLLGFAAVKGLHLGLFGWLAGPLLAKPWGIPAVAAVWVAIEGTHPYAGFTWLMLGNAATNTAFVSRLAPLTGVLGMSFVLVMLNVAVVQALRRRPRRWLAWVLALQVLFLLPPLPARRDGTRLVQLVQPNVEHETLFREPWTEQRAAQMLREWVSLSQPVADSEKPPDLIVWPENPAPFYYYGDPGFRAAVERVARERGAYLLFSTVAFRDGAQRQPLNSAVLLSPEGTEIARYDKIFLVPFGEFVPWPFGYLVEKVTREAGDFVPGERVVVTRAGAHRLGAFICYEAVFARAVRRFVTGGAELLVNLSNDGWFGPSGAREQHLLIARMRAMENGRWLLRSTNTGITAAIDPAGRVRTALPLDRPGVLLSHFDYAGDLTAYTRWGDWFWWLAVAAAVTAVAAARGHNRSLSLRKR
jgi:apolipoprotein N-acyltransferase